MIFHTFNNFFNVVSNSHLTNWNWLHATKCSTTVLALANLRSKHLILIILRPWAASRVLKLHRRSVVVQRRLLPSQMTPNISPQFIKKSISRLQHQSFKKHTHRDMLLSPSPAFINLSPVYTERCSIIRVVFTTTALFTVRLSALFFLQRDWC